MKIPAKKDCIRVASYNIQHSSISCREYLKWSHRRERVYRVIRECNPDIICLQEVSLSQQADLRSQLPEYAFFFTDRMRLAEKQGTVFLGIGAKRSFGLSVGKFRVGPMYAQYAFVSRKGKDLMMVVNSHYLASSNNYDKYNFATYERYNIDWILKHHKRGIYHWVSAGDRNTDNLRVLAPLVGRDWDTPKTELSDLFEDCAEHHGDRCTWNGSIFHEKNKIDWIVSNDKPKRTFTADFDKVASDHFLVGADYPLRKSLL